MQENIRIFIDTNIILDVLLEREPFFKGSGEIWRLVEEKEIAGFVSLNSLTDIFYISRKYIGSEKARSLVGKLLYVFDSVPLTKAIMKQALSLDIKDLEDAIQVVSAKKAFADYVISRDIKGFSSDIGIKAATPEGFLEIYREK